MLLTILFTSTSQSTRIPRILEFTSFWILSMKSMAGRFFAYHRIYTDSEIAKHKATHIINYNKMEKIYTPQRHADAYKYHKQMLHRAADPNYYCRCWQTDPYRFSNLTIHLCCKNSLQSKNLTTSKHKQSQGQNWKTK